MALRQRRRSCSKKAAPSDSSEPAEGTTSFFLSTTVCTKSETSPNITKKSTSAASMRRSQSPTVSFKRGLYSQGMGVLAAKAFS